MKKFLLAVGVIIGIGFVAVVIYFIRVRSEEKALSPEGRVMYADNDFELGVRYSRPAKKGREIFGGLVPYGKMWRTGANEATIFSSGKDVLINGQKVERGRYQLITIPYEDHWTIILNSDIPGWGINQGTGQVYRNQATDVLVTDVPVTKQNTLTEDFTISLVKEQDIAVLTFTWDSTRVNVPIRRM